MDSATSKENLYPIRIFISSTSVKCEVKYEQQRAMSILESKKIPFDVVDISKSKAKGRIMRATVEDSTANPPRFFKGEVYLGGFKDFIESVDEGRLENWLHLTTNEAPPPKEEKKDICQNPQSYEHMKRRLDSAIKDVDSMTKKS